MSAKIIVFPGCSISVPNATIPVVTIGRYRSVPKHAPYKAPSVLVDGVAGWAVEALNHPAGGIGILAFHRDEAVAWQEAARLAAQNGWRAERNRRLAVATARQMIAEVGA